jgi:hypothetical protein
MIADDDLDRFSKNPTAHILNSHARGIGRSLAAEICIRAGLVIENPDADAAPRALRSRVAIEE